MPLSEVLAAAFISPSSLRPRECQDSPVSLGIQKESEKRGLFVPLPDG